MLNKIILSVVQKPDSYSCRAMVADDFENPSTYKDWIYPLRYLLALRYLKHKQKILAWFKTKKVYPVHDNDFKDALISQLSGNTQKITESQEIKIPILAAVFNSILVYPILLAALIFGTIQLNIWHKQRKLENILANHLPYFSDLLHRKLLLKHNNGSSQIEKIDAILNLEKERILVEMPERDGIRKLMEHQLEKLKDSTVSSEDIMLGFKDINTLFDQKGLPYYLTPKSFSMPCSSLIDASVEEMMMLKKLEELMSNNNPELCRTTMMTVYKVEERKALFLNHTPLLNTASKDNKTIIRGGGVLNKNTELPLFRVKRMDKVPAIDSALGLTFKERGLGSIILIDRIEKFSQESVLPALTFQGRNYIIPYWMQGYYEIEEAVTKGYKKDLQDIFPDKSEFKKVKTIVKKLIKRNKTQLQNAKLQQTLERNIPPTETNIFGNGFDAVSVLLGKAQKDNSGKKHKNISLEEIEDIKLLKKLEDVLLPSIEYHEAYHQINKENWKQPAWVKTTFKDLSDNGIEHTMEELGAYLSQLANTQQGQNIWLSKLLIFSLNPMTKGQAEYYASSLIFNTMESLYLNKPIDNNYHADVDKKTLIYKTLLTKDKPEIRELARRAYEVLFEREVPSLSTINNSLN